MQQRLKLHSTPLTLLTAVFNKICDTTKKRKKLRLLDFEKQCKNVKKNVCRALKTKLTEQCLTVQKITMLLFGNCSGHQHESLEAAKDYFVH